MRRGGQRINFAKFLELVGLTLLLAAGASSRPRPPAGKLFLALDPAHSKIHWTLGATAHTVRGTFGLKRGTLRFDPATGKTTGEIVADAASGESGNQSRDERMHKEILESERFSEVIFRPDYLEGKVSPQGPSSVQLHGTFVIHGLQHELTVPVQAELHANHWKATAKFSVPYVDWGLKNPSGFLLKVDRSVEIALEMSGSLQTSAAP